MPTPTRYWLFASSSDLCLKRFWVSGWCRAWDSVGRATTGRLGVVGVCAEDRKRRHCCVGVRRPWRFFNNAREGAIGRDMLCVGVSRLTERLVEVSGGGFRMHSSQILRPRTRLTGLT